MYAKAGSLRDPDIRNKIDSHRSVAFYGLLRPIRNRSRIGCGMSRYRVQFCYENALDTQKFLGIASIFMGTVHAVLMVARRFSAASSASARLSKKVEAAGTPGPTKGSGRHAPDRGCQRQLTGVKIAAKKETDPLGSASLMSTKAVFRNSAIFLFFISFRLIRESSAWCNQVRVRPLP